MKTILKLTLIFVIFIINTSKAQNVKKTKSREITSNVTTSNINSKDELYIGKEFYAGDELNTYTFITSKKINDKDSLTYSIYKKNDIERYSFSIEKLVSNEDKGLYKILDLFVFTHYKTENHRVKILNTTNGYSVLFIKKDEILKKWEFDLDNNKINKIWEGKYKCNFLRIREESADPRAYAMIVITIKGNNATFQLEGYNEVLNKQLLVLNSGLNKIILHEKNQKDSKFTITKSNNKFILTSDLLNKITGEVKTYKLQKN
ncbi:hypothetical protein [Pedobacter roseus]|uniref:Uncharacterized protein n=1 Tax=Pedobacter roseus TaxID=336820 RepID=A0A7G9QHW5_9SPHI|nr:hypothetical protein [Pedobacter roseus]QNN42940.1 hypothetical protein H9L23_02205 [Pedobacter roseus]